MTDEHAAFLGFLDRVGLTRDELSTDVENVMRRDLAAGHGFDLDTYRGADGRLYLAR